MRAPETLSKAEEALVKEKEGSRISRYFRNGSVKIILAIEGRSLHQRVSEKLKEYALNGYNQLDFVIGGSLGLIRNTAPGSLLLSFSSFTFPIN